MRERFDELFIIDIFVFFTLCDAMPRCAGTIIIYSFIKFSFSLRMYEKSRSRTHLSVKWHGDDDSEAEGFRVKVVGSRGSIIIILITSELTNSVSSDGLAGSRTRWHCPWCLSDGPKASLISDSCNQNYGKVAKQLSLFHPLLRSPGCCFSFFYFLWFCGFSCDIRQRQICRWQCTTQTQHERKSDKCRNAFPKSFGVCVCGCDKRIIS